MRFFTARRLALAALVPALLSLTFIPGCSQQGEGERCGDENGATDSDDCGSGLVCKTISASPAIYRCCRADLRVTDSRCIPGSSSSAGAGGSSGGAAAGAAGETTDTPTDAGAGGA